MFGRRAYDIQPYVQEETREYGRSCFRILVTGNIDRYVSLWGNRSTRYLGQTFAKPMIEQDALKRRYRRRYQQATSSKILIAGIRHFEAYLDHNGEYLGAISTITVRDSKYPYSLSTLTAILNSQFMKSYIREVYGTLAMDAGINFTAPLVSELPLPIGIRRGSGRRLRSGCEGVGVS